MLHSVNNRQEIRSQILNAGVKATLQRIIILEAVIALYDQHPTAEEVYQHLTVTNPGISLGTVYKTLDSFVAVGLLKRVLSGNSKRYDLMGPAHGHIYCTKTQQIMDYADPELEKLLLDFFQTKNIQNFKIQDISVQIVGTKTEPAENIIIT